jgi:predicted small metal-binding protein
MAYSLQCRDSGADCPGSFTTETEEELRKHVELHVQEAHPEMNVSFEDVKPLVKTTAPA